MKRTLAALLAVLMTMLLWVEPARAADQPLEVSLKTPIEKITTRHIQELELSVKNSENQPRKVRLVMALVDYKGNVFSRAVSELTLKENKSASVKEHLKILPKAYEVRVFAEDTAGKILSNTLRQPSRAAIPSRTSPPCRKFSPPFRSGPFSPCRRWWRPPCIPARWSMWPCSGTASPT